MKKLLLLLLVVANTSFAFTQDFPMGPTAGLTPGKLCDQPTSYRYQENIKYCERDVSPQTKAIVFDLYRRKAGFPMVADARDAYKVDHYFPLCAGGSNDISNLWPQHKSISAQTDSIEEKGCEKMLQGRLSQHDFIGLIIKVKNDLRLVPQAHLYLNRL